MNGCLVVASTKMSRLNFGSISTYVIFAEIDVNDSLIHFHRLLQMLVHFKLVPDVEYMRRKYVFNRVAKQSLKAF